jgi:hypothetical protein
MRRKWDSKTDTRNRRGGAGIVQCTHGCTRLVSLLASASVATLPCSVNVVVVAAATATELRLRLRLGAEGKHKGGKGLVD